MYRKLLFLMGLIGLGVATYLILPDDFDSDLFWATFRTTHLGWLAVSIAASFLAYAIRAIRWHFLLLPLKPVGFASLMSATVLGFGAIFTIGRPGELVRPVWIGRQEGIPTMGAMASIIIERVFDILSMLLLFIAGSVWVDLPESTRLSLGGLGAPWQMLSLGVVALAGFFFLHRYCQSLARLMPFESLRRLMESFARGLAGTSTPKSMTIVGLCSAVLWIVHTLQFWFMLESVGLDFSLAATAVTVVLTSLGSIAQIPGIGGGFQAGFILSATAVLGTAAEISVAASLMVWFISTIPTIIASAGYMMWKGVSARDLRMEESELSAS